LLYNAERMFETINLSSFVYVVAAAGSLLLLISPWLQRLPLTWLLVVLLPAVVLLKRYLGYRVMGVMLPITVTELCALSVTVLLARQLGRGLEEFRGAVAAMMVGYLHDRSVPFKNGQGEIYREIRRARIYHRPLAMLAVAAPEEQVQMSLDRFLQEVERETVRHYVTGRIADFLSTEMKDCDIITQRGGHFVLLLPETARAQAEAIVARLVASAREHLQLELNVGLSVFPEQGSTFVSLLESAEDALRQPAAAPHQGNGHAAASSVLPVNVGRSS
jgi:hypothetical protein